MRDMEFMNKLSDESATPNPEFVAKLGASVSATSAAAIVAASGQGVKPRSTSSNAVKVVVATAVVAMALAGVAFGMTVIRGDQDAPMNLQDTGVIMPEVQETDDTSDVKAAVDSVDEEAEENRPESSVHPAPAHSLPPEPDKVAVIQIEPPEVAKVVEKVVEPPLPPPEKIVLPEPVDEMVYASFWNVDNFTGQYVNDGLVEIPDTEPDYETTYTEIDEDWILGSPDPSIDDDYFVMKATQQKLLVVGTYDINITRDDGLRLSIDGELVIDEWTQASSIGIYEYEVISEKVHTIDIEYFERKGGARLSIDIELQTPPVAPPTL